MATLKEKVQARLAEIADIYDAMRYGNQRTGRVYERHRSIQPHASLTSRCRSCGVSHKRGQHRAHGRGSFERTHPGNLDFNFNPPKRSWEVWDSRDGKFTGGFKTEHAAFSYVQELFNAWKRSANKDRVFPFAVRESKPRILDFGGGLLGNPPKELIYRKALSIIAQRGKDHKCSKACKAAGHRYRHKFTTGPAVYGLDDGSILISGGTR